jgi:hypothetical protein
VESCLGGSLTAFSCFQSNGFVTNGEHVILVK